MICVVTVQAVVKDLGVSTAFPFITVPLSSISSRFIKQQLNIGFGMIGAIGGSSAIAAAPAALGVGLGALTIAGGVAANKGLRSRMQEEMDKLGIKLTVPKFKYCTDNAAMIAVAGYFKDKTGK